MCVTKNGTKKSTHYIFCATASISYTIHNRDVFIVYAKAKNVWKTRKSFLALHFKSPEKRWRALNVNKQITLRQAEANSRVFKMIYAL